MTRDKSLRERMAEVYAHGEMAEVVDMCGGEGLMNLGWAPPRSQRAFADRQRDLVNRLHDLLSLEPAARVLDLGCGKGGALSLLASRHPDLFMVGVNVDPAQLALAAKHLEGQQALDRIRLICADALALPFDQDTFDAVYAMELGSHIERRDLLAREIVRVLKPGGRLAMTFMTLNRPFKAFDTKARAYLKDVASWFDEDPEAFGTAEDYQNLMTYCGLRSVSFLNLTDGVFHHRYVDHLTALKALSEQGLELSENLSPSFLQKFLELNTLHHPCRYYEYYLAVWQLPTTNATLKIQTPTYPCNKTTPCSESRSMEE